MWDAFDQVIQGSLTSTVDAPASDFVVANHATVVQMVHVYVTEPTINRVSDPVKWWAENDVKKLAPVARQILCPPATSVPSERLFSGAGLICSDHRSRLAAERLTNFSLFVLTWCHSID